MADDGWIFRSQRTFASDPQAGKEVLEDVLAALERLQWVPHDIFSVHLAMEEALVNAIKHGNRGDASKQVHVDCRIGADLFWVRICDEGQGFDPEDVPDPTDEDRLDVPSGRGIMLMRSFMSRVEYVERGTCVVMEKRRGEPRAGAESA